MHKSLRHLRFLKKLSGIHIPSKNNILLLSTPRSGSTMLLEMIAEQPLMRPIREPLNVRKKHIQEMTGLKDWEDFYRNENFPIILNYLKKFNYSLLVDSRFKRDKIFSHTWHPITNRLVYKILHGVEDRVDILKEELKAKAVILLRHPIPVTFSREELPRLEAVQSSDYRNHFNSDQLSLAKQITEEGSTFEKGILSWCFQNKLFYQQREGNLFITYEEMILKRECIIEHLCTYFDLPYPDKMLKRSRTPSGSAGKSTKKSRKLLNEVVKGNEEYRSIVEKWGDKTTDKMKEDAQNILDTFEIDIYSANEFLPKKSIQLCN